TAVKNPRKGAPCSTRAARRIRLCEESFLSCAQGLVFLFVPTAHRRLYSRGLPNLQAQSSVPSQPPACEKKIPFHQGGLWAGSRIIHFPRGFPCSDSPWHRNQPKPSE